MSGDLQPFNELGQILSQGGEQALAKAIFAGFTDERIILLFARLFEPMRPADREALRDLAEQMVAAGGAIGALGPGGTIGPGDIPLNPYLYGDEAAGRRVRVNFDIEIEGFNRLVNVTEDFPDIPNIDELREAAQKFGAMLAEKYPGDFGLAPGQELNILNLIIPFTERRF